MKEASKHFVNTLAHTKLLEFTNSFKSIVEEYNSCNKLLSATQKSQQEKKVIKKYKIENPDSIVFKLLLEALDAIITTDVSNTKPRYADENCLVVFENLKNLDFEKYFFENEKSEKYENIEGLDIYIKILINY